MKAIGRNLIIKKEKELASKTKGGLILTENQKEDIRYKTAEVVSVGEDVSGIEPGSRVYFDKAAGHNIEIQKEIFQVIKLQDIVVVL
jgi:co-chaperonin GroES (HSP10)|tara:strand:- start:116 stop:376 length:261 start_codon:yes stop_codon:yes gene_type:complete